MLKEAELDITELLSPSDGSDRNVVRTMTDCYLHLEQLPAGRKQAIATFDGAWTIIACWFVHRRTGKGNPKKHPFNTVEFKAHRSFAKFLSVELDLCRVVFEVTTVDLPYTDPHDFFDCCVGEWKEWGYAGILRNVPHIEFHKRRKTNTMRTVLGSLEKKCNPFIYEESQKHHSRLINAALELLNNERCKDLRWREFHSTWELFKKSFREHINDIHRNNNLKGFEVNDDVYRCIDVGNRRRAPNRPNPTTLIHQVL